MKAENAGKITDLLDDLGRAADDEDREERVTQQDLQVRIQAAQGLDARQHPLLRRQGGPAQSSDLLGTAAPLRQRLLRRIQFEDHAQTINHFSY